MGRLVAVSVSVCEWLCSDYVIGPQDTGNTDNTKADGNTKTDGNTKADGGTKAPSTTRYMKLAVGGLIAALVCGLLGYLLYHYRTKVGLYCSIVYNINTIIDCTLVSCTHD